MAESQTPPDAGTPPPDGTPQKPEGVPDKFWNKETGQVNHKEWGISRTQLEQKLSSYGETAAKLKVPGTGDEAPPLPENATPEDYLERMGLNPKELAEQFVKKGHLTAAQVETFKKAGIPEAFVNDYYEKAIGFTKAQIAVARDASIKFAGGKEQLQTLLDWGTQNLPEDQHPALQAQLMDPKTMLATVKGIWADHRVAVGAGNTQPLISGDAAPPSTGGYASQSEMHKAQNDPRYFSNKGYKEAVDARIGATDDRVILGL